MPPRRNRAGCFGRNTSWNLFRVAFTLGPALDIPASAHRTQNSVLRTRVLPYTTCIATVPPLPMKSSTMLPPLSDTAPLLMSLSCHDDSVLSRPSMKARRTVSSDNSACRRSKPSRSCIGVSPVGCAPSTDRKMAMCASLATDTSTK